MLDLKSEEGKAALRSLVAGADVLVENFAPGAMERLGLGPDVALKHNPRIIYGRMTGFGQEGPMAPAAGHDINYIALSGVLHAFGNRGGKPVPPLNLVGDFGGGGMMLAFGMVCALLEAQKSGKGQVIDAAMTDGTALLTAMFRGFKEGGSWKTERHANFLDGAAHYYDNYRCADGISKRIDSKKSDGIASSETFDGAVGDRIGSRFTAGGIRRTRIFVGC